MDERCSSLELTQEKKYQYNTEFLRWSSENVVNPPCLVRNSDSFIKWPKIENNFYHTLFSIFLWFMFCIAANFCSSKQYLRVPSSMVMIPTSWFSNFYFRLACCSNIAFCHSVSLFSLHICSIFFISWFFVCSRFAKALGDFKQIYLHLHP